MYKTFEPQRHKDTEEHRDLKQNTMKLPSQTAEIFETLSKGQFICSNSVHDENRKLYNIIDDNFEELYTYFEAIGFVLEKGTNISTSQEKKRKRTLNANWSKPINGLTSSIFLRLIIMVLVQAIGLVPMKYWFS
jgi:hypothetical protein